MTRHNSDDEGEGVSLLEKAPSGAGGFARAAIVFPITFNLKSTCLQSMTYVIATGRSL